MLTAPVTGGRADAAQSRDEVKRVSRLLSGYLCGTRSGALARLRAARRPAAQADRATAEAIAAAHRGLGPAEGGPAVLLGTEPWRPDDRGAAALRDRLRAALAHPAVVELVLFGSQARGGATGFSDVDALLVIEDEGAEDPAVLRSLRPRVLAAQRAVLAYQPMQHHGFQVLTPRLLLRADEASELPAVALEETRSLWGRAVSAHISGEADATRARGRLVEIAQAAAVGAWPTHPWETHRLVAMLELLPALYLQSRGAPIPKWRSFAEAAPDFGPLWRPYEVLERVRGEWPRLRRRELEAAAALARNPWTAVALWRRLPVRVPAQTRLLLSDECLDGLRTLAGEMARRAP